MNKLVPLLALILLSATTLATTTVNANVPTVLTITRRTDASDNTLVDVKVSHADPTSNHYISQITLDLDGTTKTQTDLPKATTVEATYTINIGATNPKTIKAQATCNIHGPSTWFNESGTSGGTSSGVSAYPLEAVALGTVIAVAAILLRRR